MAKSKERKMIDLDDLLDEHPDPTSNDMIFITATDDSPPTEAETRRMSRLERIQSTAVNVEEPLFDGETDLDMGTISLNREEDAQRIRKEQLLQQQITEESDKQKDDIVNEMSGEVAEDIIEEFGMDVPTVPADTIDRKSNKRANKAAVDEILRDLFRK